MKRTSLIFFLGIIALVFLVAFSGYKYWEKSVLDQELQKIESDLADTKNKLITYQIEEVNNAINAKRTIDSLEIIKWSVVIDSILDVLPKKEIVNIVSYAASSTDNLSMNVKTLAGQDKPHLNIADFIQYFNENDNFVDNFVSSISSGTNEDGEEILTFSFTNSYVGDFSAKAVEVDTPKVEEPVEKIERT